nr:glutathione binding-like protein [Gluconobacter cerinus]
MAKNRFVAGDEFTIADIAHFGWLWRRGFPSITLDDTPHVARWYADIESRPAVQRGIARIEALVPQD